MMEKAREAGLKINFPTVNLVTRAIPDFASIGPFVLDLAKHEIVGKELGADAAALLNLALEHARHHRFFSE